ncbi:choice-of-anchor R domain-containing protein [Candidatus Poriferisodalis sp.]|uniref:choice-of-anchor R domain-containing protein n=1 Tax=Candidatus Poriferisodalis sp. TaxID=3101277 RepID=UPI003B596B3A
MLLAAVAAVALLGLGLGIPAAHATQGTAGSDASVSEGDTDLPNDNSTWGRVVVGGSATGTVGFAKDQDRFAVDLKAGRAYQFDLIGSPGSGGTLRDTYFRAIYNSAGRYQSSSYNDNFGGSRDSRVTFTPEADGTYYARVSGDRNETGTYTLRVSDVTPEQQGNPPPKPIGLTAVAAHDWVILTWADPGNDSISGYLILRRNRDTTSTGEFSILEADTGSAETRYTDYDVAADTPYTYRIMAINEYGVSDRSRWFHARTDPPPQVVFIQGSQGDGHDGQDGGHDGQSGDGQSGDGHDGHDGQGDGHDGHDGQGDGHDGHDGQGDGHDGHDGQGDGHDGQSGDDQSGDGHDGHDGQSGDDQSGDGHDGHDGQSGDDQSGDWPGGHDGPYGELKTAASPAVDNRNSVSEPANGDLLADDSTAGVVEAGGFVTGNIEVANDVDWFRVELVSGRQYQFDLEGSATGHGTLGDPFLTLYDDSSTRLGRYNDGGEGFNSRARYTATASSTHYLAASEPNDATGTYTLTVRDLTPAVDRPAPEDLTVWLSNFGGHEDDLGQVPVRSIGDVTQGFTTGPQPGGYLLDSIDLRVELVPASPAEVTIALWSATSNAQPEALVTTLTRSAEEWTDGANRFDAPADTVLDPDTTYFVYMAYDGGGLLMLADTISSHADSSDDWSLGQRFQRTAREGVWRSFPGAWMVFSVSGTEAAPPTGPMITGVEVTSTPQEHVYGAGEDIEFAVSFDEAVQVTGSPVLEFCLGPSGDACEAGGDGSSLRQATLSGGGGDGDGSGSGTETLVFTYQVVADDDAHQDPGRSRDRDPDGIWIGEHSLRLEDGDAIRSVATGDDAIVRHAAVGTLGGHRVDGSRQIDGHTHQAFTHSHAHYNGGKRYYSEVYPSHTHESHIHPDDPPHPTWMRPGLHVHHQQEPHRNAGHDVRTHESVAHTHICMDIKPSCNQGGRYWGGRYGGVLPREVTHRHADSEPGHGYTWPDLRAGGNRPAEGEPYVGWGAWRVTPGTTLSADMWRVSDPDGMTGAVLEYQWLSGYREIAGATGTTYTTTEADVGDTMRVRVRFTDDAGNREELRSRSTLSVVAHSQQRTTGQP